MLKNAFWTATQFSRVQIIAINTNTINHYIINLYSLKLTSYTKYTEN